MNAVVWVGLGGMLGSMARYGVSLWLPVAATTRFPIATFAVNVAGCLVAGVLAGGVARAGWFSGDVRLFLFTGVLGGFTTFSAFGLDALALARRGEFAAAGTYVAASVLAGLAAAFLGFRLAAR